MTTREFLLEFLKFHYKQNPFRKQETNEKDVDDFIAELPAGFEVKNLSSNTVLPAVKSFPLKQSECKHREQPRTWHEEYSTWRCDGCGKWYE